MTAGPSVIQKLSTIHGKQLSLAVLVSVVPLLLIGIISSLISMNNISTDLKSDLKQIIQDKALAIQSWIAERRADVSLLATSDHLNDFLHQRQQSADEAQSKHSYHHFYDNFAKEYGSYSGALVFDREGRLLDSYPIQVDLDFQTIGMSGFREENSLVSDAFLLDGKAHLLVSSFIREESETVGYLMAVVNLEAVNSITDNIRVGSTGEAYLVNRKGFFVTHKDRFAVLSKNISSAPAINRLFSGDELDFVAENDDYRGVAVMGAYKLLPRLNWGLVVEQDRGESFKPVADMALTFLVLLVISSFLVASTAYYLTARNLRPLYTLRSTIEKIRGGDLTIRFPVTKDDEIGLTGAVFNEMLDKLQETQKSLEGKVEASDKELVRAYDQLQNRHAELQKAQERLLKTERLSVMGEVAAGLAHEINNPLSTISMLIQTLGDGEDCDYEEQKQAKAIIIEEIEKIASMIGRFQDLTHPAEMRNEPIVIDRVIDKTTALLRPKLIKSRIKLSVEVARELPRVMGDERLLSQLLLNVCLNSINAMPNGGNLSIEASCFVNFYKERYLRVRVSDTGYGIPRNVMDKIFNPFFTTRAEGTGLGLLLVLRTTERHGGRIDIQSTEGKGTVLTLDFPERRK